MHPKAHLTHFSQGYLTFSLIEKALSKKHKLEYFRIENSLF